MALRLQCRGWTQNNIVFDLLVYDEDYIGSVVDFTPDDQGFVINKQAEGEQLTSLIVHSKCEIFIWVDNTGVDNFITQLNTAYEGRFRLEVKYAGVTHWVGQILPDLVTIEDLPIAQLPRFKLVATDGIKRLKKIDYKDTGGPYTGKESLKDHFINCISFIGLTDLITGNWVFEMTYDWWAASQDTGDPAANQRFDHRALYQVDKKGEFVFMSVYDVIKMLCRTLDGKFMMDQGVYKFIQHNIYTQASRDIYRYQDNGTLFGSSTANIQHLVDSNFTGKFGGGEFGFFPALNEVDVNYIHYGFLNVARGFIWGTNESTTVVPVAPTTYEIPADTAFFFKADLNFVFVYGPTKPAYISINVRLNVGSDYMKRTVNYFTANGSIATLPKEITTDTADRFEFVILLGEAYDPGSGPVLEGTTRLEFTSLPFPNDGTVQMEIEYGGIYDIDGNLITSGMTQELWRASNVELSAVPDGDLAEWKNTKSVTVPNSVTGNTEKMVLNNIIGEADGYGKLEVYNGSAWIIGTDWGAGASAAGISFERLLGEEIMKRQAAPVKKMRTNLEKYDSTYLNKYESFEALVHGSDIWVFWKGSYVAHPEAYKGEWYLIKGTGTAGTVTEIDKTIDDLNTRDGGNDILTVEPLGPGGGTPAPAKELDKELEVIAVQTVLNNLFPRLTADIETGDTVTSIPIPARTQAGEYTQDQVITLVSKTTGAQQNFTVSADTEISDTAIQVTSDTAAYNFLQGSWVVASQDEPPGGPKRTYREKFTTPPTAVLSITENGASLPKRDEEISVYTDNGQVITKTYWSHVATAGASTLTLTFDPTVYYPGQDIWVEFKF